MHPVTLNNAVTTVRLVGHTVYLKRQGIYNVFLTDEKPRAPYIEVTPDGEITEVK